MAHTNGKEEKRRGEEFGTHSSCKEEEMRGWVTGALELRYDGSD